MISLIEVSERDRVISLMELSQGYSDQLDGGVTVIILMEVSQVI